MAGRRLTSMVLTAGVLLSPAVPPALAGTYSWQLPTATAPGDANPDHDGYGAAPWSYVDASAASMVGPPSSTPASLQPLSSFSSSIDGGLTGWYDPSDPDQPFVADNRGGSAVGPVAPGQLALQPAGDRVVGIGWTSPLSDSATVAASGTFMAASQAPSCVSRPTWTLEQDGAAIAQGSGQSISATTTIAPGDSLYLIIGWSGVHYDASCTTAEATLSIQAPASPPSVSLSAPGAGDAIKDAQPTFSGQASTGFGAVREVTVRVWSGSSAVGAPVLTLDADASTGRYAATPKPPLANGTYTARAEQDDLAGDSSFSAPVTFSIHNLAPAVAISGLPKAPLRTPTPLITGTADTSAGAGKSIYVVVWDGSSADGTALRYLVGTRARGGRWAVRVEPGLPNGRYAVEAVQVGTGGLYGVSRRQGFTVRAPVIPAAPRVDSSGKVTVPITCTAPSACSGDVLVLTAAALQPAAAGPRGRVRVLYGYVQAAAGATVVVRGTLPSYIVRALERAGPLRVRVAVSLRDSAGRLLTATSVLRLRLGR